VINLLIADVAAYLLGSIPSGLFWAWAIKHIDARQSGSGRTGMTNVWRTAGFVPALLTAICDGLKGAAAIWGARILGLEPWGVAMVGAAAVVGHNYSLYLKFKGGAGTMISIGIAAALWAGSLPILAGGGVLMALLMGHASIASICIAGLLPVLFGLRGNGAYALGFGLPTMALTLWALRPNIGRLLKGKERFLPMYLKKPPLIRLCRHPSKLVTGD